VRSTTQLSGIWLGSLVFGRAHTWSRDVSHWTIIAGSGGTIAESVSFASYEDAEPLAQSLEPGVDREISQELPERVLVIWRYGSDRDRKAVTQTYLLGR